MTLISIPLLVACALALTPLFVKVLGRHAGWPIVAFFIAAAVQLARLAGDVFGEHAGSAHAVEFSAPWAGPMLSDSVSIEFALRLDPLSFVFSMLALLIGSVVFIYSTAYLPPKDPKTGGGKMSFYLLMTAFMLAVILLVLANDVALLFIGWELVSMASFMLIARSGSAGEPGSIRTLLLTFTGGLLLLAGLAVAVWATGTTNVSELLAHPVWHERPGVTAATAILIGLAGFTKAAQLPFHAWLPEAMAAITPVSAFLHAAAVVKAGIYLLLRFAEAFAHISAWQYLLIIAGMATAVATAFFAIQQTDIKKLIAYSTVSQLGWIVATIGVGTQFAIVAAVVHTMAHAMFKSSLFMLAGVVDHEAGTRDLRRMGPLWSKMPWTFGSMIIGAASMAAIPPTFGFMSKEGMLEAFTEAPLSNSGVVVLLIAAGIGAFATFTYSARLVFGVFIDGSRDVSKVHEAPVALWLPAALPGVLSLPVAFFAGVLFDDALNSVATTVSGSPYADAHLALWHGINVPFIISMIVLVAGFIAIVARKSVYGVILERKLFPFTGVQALEAGTKAAAYVGRGFGKLADSHSPSRHLAPLLAILVAYGALVFITGDLHSVGGEPLSPKLPDIDHPLDLLPLIVILLAGGAVVLAKNRLQATILLGVLGTGVTLQIMLLGAPDVALTQFLVELLTVVLMMLVLRHQPRAFAETSSRRKWMGAIVGIGTGLVTFAAVWTLTGRRQITEIGNWYLENTYDVTGEKNIVNVILVEFRAFDTLGELAVLGMAGVAMGAVVASVPRWPHLLDQPGDLVDPKLNTLYMRQLNRWLVPILLVTSALVFYRGGNEPGGAFNAALIGTATFMLIYLARDTDRPVIGKTGPYWLSACGVALAIVVGFFGYFKEPSGSFLAPLYGYLGDTHLTSALIFDAGVYLAVLGITAAALNNLGGSERPGSAKSDADLGPAVANRTSLTVGAPSQELKAQEAHETHEQKSAHSTKQEA